MLPKHPKNSILVENFYRSHKGLKYQLLWLVTKSLFKLILLNNITISESFCHVWKGYCYRVIKKRESYKWWGIKGLTSVKLRPLTRFLKYYRLPHSYMRLYNLFLFALYENCVLVIRWLWKKTSLWGLIVEDVKTPYDRDGDFTGVTDLFVDSK